MELWFWSSLLVIISSTILITLWLLGTSNGWKQRPPGPPGWPVLGNIFDLGPLPHQTMYKLVPKYGPLLWLNLCSVNTLVVQSAKAAAELFKNHDLAFSGRACPDAFTALGYNLGTIAFASPTPYWRNMKRVCSTHLFSNALMNQTLALRHKCVDQMVSRIEESASRGVQVNLARQILVFTFSVAGNVIFSRDFSDSEGSEFFKVTCEVLEEAVKPNIADSVAWLKWLDPQGRKRNMTRLLGQFLNILSTFIAKRVEEHKLLGFDHDDPKDMLDALLQYKLQEDTNDDSTGISEHNMSIVLMEIFLAVSGTVSSTIEWAFSEVLRNPKVLTKAREELDIVIGATKKVEENNIDNLLYLQAVVKESLRLNPTAPLLIPHYTSQDTNFMGYLIPKNTQVLVNAYSIGRDPNAWHEPLSFNPERFMDPRSNKGSESGCEFIPFGAGRRMCAGMPLAHRVIHIALASLIHSFDWELGDGGDPQAMDMNQKMGIAVRKLVPLKAIPGKRTTTLQGH